METFQSNSSQATAEFGEKLARSVLKAKFGDAARGATIITLHGDLGAGKTTFTQGFARALGITRRLISPTFVIMRRYPIPAGRKSPVRKQFKNLYHIDAYRLKNPDGLETLGLRAIFSDPTAIVLVEWPENIKKLVPKDAVRVEFAYGKNETERTINYF
jgi:tRNA threonylcarbamoyladenosine biosynthesis protein TsaE